ncbi:uncharacterized protein LOC114936567 [Nylanderia fulva]|uniref:uncharacterized protein LOC114935139 n=1 Tax=Nylanderia fulva TaxID=613905 RepID=UPI0010FB253E|nr:uncharacterized protein LOC114935139 [Nylanderia fulva]XP_029165644.1 uncharacterized protein LOC114936567 [Nylanderia fulva]
MEELALLVRQRGRVRARLTAFKTFLAKLNDNPEKIVEIRSRIEKAEQLWIEFDTIQNKIEDIDDSDIQESERITFEDLYHELLSKARTISMIEGSTSSATNFNIQPIAQNDPLIVRPMVKLPNIDLPKFDENYERWIPFRDLFESLIASNVVLLNVQKLHYLRSALTGEAAKVIDSLEISNDNYAVAWNLLKQRFENKRLIVQYLIQKLLDIPAITKESHADLRQLVDNISQYTQSSIKLGQPVESWSTIIIHIILPKIDKGSRREWEAKRSVIEAFPTLTEFIDYLVNRSGFLEAVNRANQNLQGVSNHVRRDNKAHPSHTKNVTQAYVTSSDSSCVLCSGNHRLRECQAFLKMPVRDRISETKKKRLCIKCLREFYGRSCKASNCKTCKGYHNTLLHITDSPDERSSERVESNNTDTVNTVLNHCSVRDVTHVFLATAIIYIRDSHGNPHECRALLDSGSQSNFITKNFCERLHLTHKTIDLKIKGISNTPISAIQTIQATIESRVNSAKFTIPFIIINQITEYLPTIKISQIKFDIPPEIKLADPTFCTPGKIDALLGASIFWELMCMRQIRSAENTPIFQETLLGWIIFGAIPIDDKKQRNNEVYCGLSTCALQQQLEKFWTIEEVKVPPHCSSKEKQCEEHFISTRRDIDGRFIVQLPLKDTAENLGESYIIAEKRFKALERKLERQSELKAQYHEFMAEYLKLHHISEVQIEEKHNKPAYYIPHHAVTKEDSTTTKLRVVFDASCKTSSGKSLNDILMLGPILQNSLFDIIIRLRQHKYAMAADIAKMYRQIAVDHKDRKFQRILWRWDKKDPVQTFELNTVTYGMTSSPFLAIRCLQEVAQQMISEYQNAGETIIRDFYVDDLLTGADTIGELIQLKQEIIHILSFGKFELRKWISNLAQICDQFDNEKRQITSNESTKILGLLWNTKTDAFQYRIKLNISENKTTKRIILANIAQIYDPLGLLGPIIVQGKILMQYLWQSKCKWDEGVTTEIKDMWLQWKSQIGSVEQLTIPRRMLCDNPEEIEVHGFCDASEKAYGACLYFRTTNSRENYTVRLVCAKSRIAPIKRVSLPRLELCSAVLLANLVRNVLQSLTIQIHKVYYWTDSTIVLAWIAREPTHWKTFVANRVAEIQRETKNAQWYHVRSEDNPADLLSREVSPAKLKEKRIWWEGPQFLQHNSVFVPFSAENIYEDITEKRTTNLLVLKEANEYMAIIERFSSLSRLKRVTAYCLRLAKRSVQNTSQQSKLLTVLKLEHAMKTLIKGCQAHSFAEELHNLSNKKRLQSKSKLLTLNPFLDEEGIIRVGGRLCNATIEYSQKHPIILPSKHHLTTLIIRDAHYKNLHAGSQAILMMVRNNYWPISGREAVRRVLRSCIVCFRAKPTVAHQLMGNLPAVRVTQQIRAFLHTGLDYAGPFTIKISRNKTSKAYLAIFICLVTKAVHFELVSDLTTTAFLNALKRFIARRGKCIALYSDNGTTFVGANNQLTELKNYLIKETTQNQIHEYLAEHFIDWKFIPPYSPHIGGLWEAAVKSAKTHMRKIIGTVTLTFEELYTVFTLIEACLNSRPLTQLSNDPTDLQPLTPGHFLIGEAINTIPEHDLSDVSTNRLTRYQLIIQLRQHFWTRWSKEYIVQLQQRIKWKQEGIINLSKGMMVLLKNENTCPMTWPLGRIVEIHPGTDGITRIVTV